MKEIYKVGTKFFEDYDKAEIYSRRYYRRPAYIQTIRLSDPEVDGDKKISVYIYFRVVLGEMAGLYCSSNSGRITEPERFGKITIKRLNKEVYAISGDFLVSSVKDGIKMAKTKEFLEGVKKAIEEMSPDTAMIGLIKI